MRSISAWIDNLENIFSQCGNWQEHCYSIIKERRMKFTIEVGEHEKNTLEYSFNQLLGTLTIRVNAKEIKRATRLFNEPVKEVHVITVGETDVRIEKERGQLYRQKNRLYINNRLVKVFEGV
jgi:hypothetical protein